MFVFLSSFRRRPVKIVIQLVACKSGTSSSSSCNRTHTHKRDGSQTDAWVTSLFCFFIFNIVTRNSWLLRLNHHRPSLSGTTHKWPGPAWSKDKAPSIVPKIKWLMVVSASSTAAWSCSSFRWPQIDAPHAHLYQMMTAGTITLMMD